MLFNRLIILCSIILCSCHVYAKQTDLQPSMFEKIKQSVLRPFKQEAPAEVQPTAPPPVLWDRLRNRFMLNPHENDQRVQYYIKKFTHSKKHLKELMQNATPFLFYVAEQVEKYDMPAEIALLPMVESNYNPWARSASGARGLWQLMPRTGQYYGLYEDEWFDGCQDIILSTKAALGHLTYLKQRFNGNWLLALAAYNSGEGRVLRAIKKNKQANLKDDFWSLQLPRETRDYVPKLMALVAIVKTPEKYGVHLPLMDNKAYFTQVDLGKAVELAHAAKSIGIPEKRLTLLNAGFYKHKMQPNGPYHLCIPIDQAKSIINKRESIPTFTGERPKVYTVQKGDTLIHIAKRYQLTPQALKQQNRLQSDKIKIGQVLTLSSDASVNTKSENKSKKHIVQKGDSLWKISRQHHVSIETLKKSNNLASSSKLKPGQELVIET